MEERVRCVLSHQKICQSLKAKALIKIFLLTQALSSLTQIVIFLFQRLFGAVFVSKGYPFKNIFMMSLSDDKQVDVIDAFNTTSRY